MKPTEREQQLVDICFDCVATITDPTLRRHFEPMTLEQRMAWVRHQLRVCGFKTEPIGISWGVLKED